MRRCVGEGRFIGLNELFDGLVMKTSASSAHCWTKNRFNCNKSSSIVYINYLTSSYIQRSAILSYAFGIFLRVNKTRSKLTIVKTFAYDYDIRKVKSMCW